MVCFFCFNESSRRGSIRCFNDKIVMINHMAQCPCKPEFTSKIRNQVYELMKKGFENGFDDVMVLRLFELEVEVRK